MAVRFESREVGFDAVVVVVGDDVSGIVSLVAIKHARSFLNTSRNIPLPVMPTN